MAAAIPRTRRFCPTPGVDCLPFGTLSDWTGSAREPAPERIPMTPNCFDPGRARPWFRARRARPDGVVRLRLRRSHGLRPRHRRVTPHSRGGLVAVDGSAAAEAAEPIRARADPRTRTDRRPAGPRPAGRDRAAAARPPTPTPTPEPTPTPDRLPRRRRRLTDTDADAHADADADHADADAHADARRRPTDAHAGHRTPPTPPSAPVIRSWATVRSLEHRLGARSSSGTSGERSPLRRRATLERAVASTCATPKAELAGGPIDP